MWVLLSLFSSEKLACLSFILFIIQILPEILIFLLYPPAKAFSYEQRNLEIALCFEGWGFRVSELALT